MGEKIINLNILNNEEIYLTGGEPFLNTEIIDILRYLKKYNKKVYIFTNGVLLNQFNENFLKEILSCVKKLIITLDSFDENYPLRNFKEAEVKESIKKILKISEKKLEIKIGINILSLKNLEITLNKLIGMGVKSFSLNLIHNIKNINEKVQITSIQEFEMLFYLLSKYKIYFKETSIELFYKFYLQKKQEIIKTCICGEKFHFIDCEGKKYLCPANLSNEKNKEKCFSEECINLWEMFI